MVKGVMEMFSKELGVGFIFVCLQWPKNPWMGGGWQSETFSFLRFLVFLPCHQSMSTFSLPVSRHLQVEIIRGRLTDSADWLD